MKLFRRFLRWCPGAPGLLLRQKIYPRYFKSCGRGILFGRFLDIRQARKISLGSHVVLNNRVCLDGGENDSLQPSIILEDGVFIGESTRLISRGALLKVQEGANLSSWCQLTAADSLTIGRKVLAASSCTLGAEEKNEKEGRTSQESTATIIGDGCWLGARTKVAQGVTIGQGTIIGAHSLVSADLPAWSVCFGRPATKYCSRKR